MWGEEESSLACAGGHLVLRKEECGKESVGCYYSSHITFSLKMTCNYPATRQKKSKSWLNISHLK